ncbi:sigma-54-dependent Fis family transcriptional regulator [Stutzerimonas xanthomarina]|uniref:sigma-54-dependent Fis family transcriptional regulator n=1 Tax=Stutzerimonas xanthomarina TaxID=271420 RepID=UPI003AA7DF3B
MPNLDLYSEDAGRDRAIVASQRRCQDRVSAPFETAPLKALFPAALATAIKKAQTLLNYAVATVENTFELVEGTATAVAVTGLDGTILFSRADANLTDPAGQPIFQPGSCWSEEAVGTNAIGVSLIEQASMFVKPAEHHTTWLQSYSTCAAPLLDHRGRVVGTLAVVTKSELTQLHTLGFIRTTATLVENRMLLGEMADKTVILFHPDSGNIETIKQCILAFDKHEKLIGANAAARKYLGLERHCSTALGFSDIFDSPLDELFISGTRHPGKPLSLPLLDGREVYIVLNRGISNVSGPEFNLPHETTEAQPDTDNTHAQRKDIADFTLRDLDTGDPQVRRVIEKAQKIIGLDLPLIIEGESGVGKEIFTRAFHNSGPRRQGSFIAVNCAAIPEGLIESELFGYEEGAFTGAKRRGSVGKVLQANGGTLFLDEIGDMQLQLQGRLLRVLQERKVDRLGGDKAIAVDFSLICATHRDLRQEIQAGRFREDLYYRLNGFRILLPPLRERKDLIKLALLVAQKEGGGRKIEFSSEVVDMFERAEWPGNIRQMQMVIRTALALARPGNVLAVEHLPDEFLSDLSHRGIDAIQSENRSDCIVSIPGSSRLAELEISAIRRALASTKGNVSEAARLLGISRKTIYRKLEKIGPARHD